MKSAILFIPYQWLLQNHLRFIFFNCLFVVSHSYHKDQGYFIGGCKPKEPLELMPNQGPQNGGRFKWLVVM